MQILLQSNLHQARFQLSEISKSIQIWWSSQNGSSPPWKPLREVLDTNEASKYEIERVCEICGTYLENCSFDVPEVGDVALVLLLQLLAEAIILLSHLAILSGYLDLTVFQPVEFGCLLLVARRAEHEMLVEHCKQTLNECLFFLRYCPFELLAKSKCSNRVQICLICVTGS